MKYLLTRGKLVCLQCFHTTTPNGSFPAEGCLLLYLHQWLLVTSFWWWYPSELSWGIFQINQCCNVSQYQLSIKTPIEADSCNSNDSTASIATKKGNCPQLYHIYAALKSTSCCQVVHKVPWPLMAGPLHSIWSQPNWREPGKGSVPISQMFVRICTQVSIA